MNNNQDSKPIIPFKPQIENNQEELIAKAEDIIAPKKSKAKIILTTLVAFLLLGSVAGAVFLVRQNQDVRKEAAGCLPGCCGDPCGGCPNGQDCDIPNGACDSGMSCNPQGSGSHLDCVGNQCVYVPGAGGDNCQNHTDCQTAVSPPPAGCKNQGETGCNANECCDNSNVCHNDVCSTCGSITNASTCFTHTKCTWLNNACVQNTNPPDMGDCTPTVEGSGGAQCGTGASASVSVTATLPSTCKGLTSELKLSFSSATAECAGTQYAYNCNTTCGNAGSTAYITFPAGSKAGATETLSASCTVPNNCGACQVDISGNGVSAGERVNNSVECTTTTPTPIPAISCQCSQIKAYDTTWKLLTSADLSALKAGDKVRFTVSGTATSGTIDKSRFKINGATYKESAVKKTSTQEFYYEYTIPAGVTSFTIEAQVHHAGLNQWF